MCFNCHIDITWNLSALFDLVEILLNSQSIAVETQSTCCFFVMILQPRCGTWYLKFHRKSPLNKTFMNIHFTGGLVEEEMLPFLKIHHWNSLTFSLSQCLFMLLVLFPLLPFFSPFQGQNNKFFSTMQSRPWHQLLPRPLGFLPLALVSVFFPISSL